MIDNQTDVNSAIRALNLDSSYYKQADVISFVENPFCKVWTTVYQNHESLYSAPAIYSCLADIELEEEILKGVDWLRDQGSFNPGFYSTSDGTFYENGRSDGYDFLVKETYFHSLETGQLHVNQEFVFLFELYRGDDGCYYAIDKCGRKEMVIDVGADVVRFKTSYLMRYIAARQMLYVQFVDSRRSSLPDYPRGVKQIDSESHKDASFHYKIWYQSTEEHDYLFSMLYARSVVYPNDVSTCRISPYDGECDEDYPEFVIEELPDGTLKRFSCNPDGLANYFGANPDAPLYLTPVFFRPEVLDQYRADPHFEVSERRLSCGTQWGIEIDNSIPERVNGPPERVRDECSTFSAASPEKYTRSFPATAFSGVKTSFSDAAGSSTGTVFCSASLSVHETSRDDIITDIVVSLYLIITYCRFFEFKTERVSEKASRFSGTLSKISFLFTGQVFPADVTAENHLLLPYGKSFRKAVRTYA